MMYRYLWLALFLMHVSCKEKASSTSPLYEEVMTIHDKVMPEMNTIHQLKKQLKTISLSENKDIILDQIKELNDADDAMMDWMAEFKVPAPEMGSETQYLTQEKEKISAVSVQMYQAINDAKNLLDSLKVIQPKL